jgi:putative transposase
MPSELTRTIDSFVEYYDHQRYHEAVENVTSAYVYFGRRDGILARRKEAKQKTLQG